MEEQPRAASKQEQTKQYPEIQTVATPLKPVETPTGTHEATEQFGVPLYRTALISLFLWRAKWNRNHPDKAKFTDIVMVIATCVMTLATIAIGILAGLQWRDSGKLNTAAQQAAQAAQLFENSAYNLTGIIAQAQSNMQTMADSSMKSIEATRDSIRLDQRAWIIFHGVEGFPQLNQPWTIKAHLMNVGKTPAKDVRISCNLEPSDSEAAVSFHEKPYGAPMLYAPNDANNYCELFPITVPTVTQTMLDFLTQKRTIIFIFGSVTYDDVFKKPHWFRFCRVMHPDGKAWDNCHTHPDDTGDGPYKQQ